MRGEERDRRVAPVVDVARRAVLGVELEHRQQLDRGDAELLQIGNLLDQPGVRAAVRFADAGTGMPREAAHVHLVDDGARRGPAQRRVALPVVGARIDDHALHRRRRVVAWLAARPRGRSPSARPRRGRTDRAAPWWSRIAGRASGVAGPCDAIAVELPRQHARDEHVPVVVGAVRGRIESNHCAQDLASSSRSKNSSSTPVAVRENRLKLTPPSTTVAPRGAASADVRHCVLASLPTQRDAHAWHGVTIVEC